MTSLSATAAVSICTHLKADVVVDKVQSIAIDPAVITAFAPGGVRVEVAELCRESAPLGGRSVPDGVSGP